MVDQSMTVADVVAQVRDGRVEDFLREAVTLFARELMEAEISGEVGAGLGELSKPRQDPRLCSGGYLARLAGVVARGLSPSS